MRKGKAKKEKETTEKKEREAEKDKGREIREKWQRARKRGNLR